MKGCEVDSEGGYMLSVYPNSLLVARLPRSLSVIGVVALPPAGVMSSSKAGLSLNTLVT